MRSQSGKEKPDAAGKQNLRKLNKKSSSKSDVVDGMRKDNYVRPARFYGEADEKRMSYGYHEDYDEGQVEKNEFNSPYYEKDKDQDYDTKTGRHNTMGKRKSEQIQSKEKSSRQHSALNKEGRKNNKNRIAITPQRRKDATGRRFNS